MRRKIMVGLVAISMLSLTGCVESDRVSQNISKEADNFNVVRRLSVMSAVTNKPVFELIGAFSFTADENRVSAVVETENGVYKKHTVGFGENVVWVVEDLHGKQVSKYKYEVNFLPEMIQPFTITTED